MTKHFATIDGIKRAAVKLKRRTGATHNQALDHVAREAGFADFRSAAQSYAVSPAMRAAAGDQPVEIIEMSPELAALLKRQRDLEIAEAGPQAPELSGDYHGVDISSRWDIAHELMRMRRIVDAMPDLLRGELESIWCDSNAQAYYAVRVKRGRWYDGIEFDIRDTVRAVTDGFNGLTVEGDRNHRTFDPEWEGDDYDYGDVTEAPGAWDDLDL